MSISPALVCSSATLLWSWLMCLGSSAIVVVEAGVHGYFVAGPRSSSFAFRMTIFSIVIGLLGRSCSFRGALTILSATSIPLVTCPKTEVLAVEGRCVGRHDEKL